MIKLVTRGVKEIIILDEVQFSNADELFEDLASGRPPSEITVNWANDIVFLHNAFPWNEVTIKEYIEHGRVYWSLLRYALMPQEEYKEKQRLMKGNVIFYVRKIKTPILVEVTKILKEKIRA